jgi:hypothetical protein
VAEPVSSFREVAQEGACGFPSAAGLGRAANPVRESAGRPASRSQASKPTGGSQKKLGPVSVDPDHRAQTGADLSTGQSSPESEAGAGNNLRNSAGKRLWKRRSLRELGNQKAISTFPQPRRRRATFGYIANVPTTFASVTFSNGLTGRAAHSFHEWFASASRIVRPREGWQKETRVPVNETPFRTPRRGRFPGDGQN